MGFEPFYIPRLSQGSRKPTVTAPVYKHGFVLLFPFYQILVFLALTFSFSLLDSSPFPSLSLTSISMAFKKVVQHKIPEELDQPEVRTVRQFYIDYNWRS